MTGTLFKTLRFYNFLPVMLAPELSPSRWEESPGSSALCKGGLNTALPRDVPQGRTGVGGGCVKPSLARLP